MHQSNYDSESKGDHRFCVYLQRISNLVNLVVLCIFVFSIVAFSIQNVRQRVLINLTTIFLTQVKQIDGQKLGTGFNHFAKTHPEVVVSFVGALDVEVVESLMDRLIKAHPDTMAALINQVMLLIRTGFYSEMEFRAGE